MFSLTTDDVNDGEDNDPDSIDKVPVQRQDLNAFGVFFAYVAGDGENEHQQQGAQTDNHVRSMQADQRVERSAEEIGADGQPILVDQLVPLHACSDEEDGA